MELPGGDTGRLCGECVERPGGGSEARFTGTPPGVQVPGQADPSPFLPSLVRRFLGGGIQADPIALCNMLAEEFRAARAAAPDMQVSKPRGSRVVVRVLGGTSRPALLHPTCR